jgi:hypothetical protein
MRVCFWNNIVNVQHQIPSLLTPQLGDSLLQSSGQPWLTELEKGAPAVQAVD